MKLKRLRIEQLRQFREPFEIRDFEPGLNLFSGPNESGKSTLVRAIRAAFFERHRSRVVDDLMPWDDNAASPTIEIDFDLGDTACVLRKRFMQGKRCELTIGGQRLDGAEAEDRLAQLLGFEFAAKGASKPEHWGIPGLLWIEQGSGQLVHDAVLHATDHLRGALNDSLGELASSSGDEVLERVRAERAVLFTGTGKATGPLASVAAELLKARADLAPMTAQVIHYREQVDRLDALCRDHAADAADAPWERSRSELERARDTYASVQRQEQALAQDRAQLERLDDSLALMREQLDTFESRVRELGVRNAALERAQARSAAANAALAGFSERQQQAEDAYRRATLALRAARQAERRLTLFRQVADAQARLQALDASIGAVRAEQGRLAELHQRAAATAIDEHDVMTLRQHHQDLRELQIQQQAIATQLHFDLQPDRQLDLDGDILTGTGERILIAPAELGIPGIGRLRIAPGGKDLARLARDDSELRETHTALLERAGVSSLDQAEQRHAQYQQLLQDIRVAQQSVNREARDGIDALLLEQSELAASIGEARTALAALPDPSTTPALSPAEAEQQQELARETLGAIDREANLARQALATAEAERDSALHERDRLQQSVQDPERQQRARALELQLAQASGEHQALAARIAQQAQLVAAARPDILAQDIERLERSLHNGEREFRQRKETIIRLQSQLEAVGAQGLEEQCATLTAQVEQLARRSSELTRRAQALDLLLALLEGKRRELVRRLQAPLKKHLDHYLQLIFPQAELEIDEQLRPGPLTRPGARGTESGAFEALSFGAREQMGVLSRLAYADLLREAGRPTLIILDDALVHSDETRLAQMKRILFDAATRHQILLFTCHPAAWRDLGVAPRALDSLRSAAST